MSPFVKTARKFKIHGLLLYYLVVPILAYPIIFEPRSNLSATSNPSVREMFCGLLFRA